MTSVRFNKTALSLEEDGTWLKFCILPEDTQKARRIALGHREGIYTAEVREYRQKRSMDANGLLWVMLDKMAAALGSTKEELYRSYVKECGPFKDFTLTEGEAKTFQVAWSKLGTGWVTEQVDYSSDGERVVIRAYYGSSTYNVKQMGRLLDLVIEGAKCIGIETLPPDKIALLKEEWKRA